MLKTLLVLFSILIFSILGNAQTPPKKSNILNFEDDVIQGERKNLDLFVQLDLGTPNLDSVIFQRDNFNDFHQIDHQRRPKFKRPKR